MSLTNLTAHDLKREIFDFQEDYPKLKDDQLFILWFVRAYITPDIKAAAASLSGGSNDRGIDAVLVEDDTKSVFIIQGKYHAKLGAKSEKHADVVSFAEIAATLSGDHMAFANLCDGMSPQVQE